MGGGIRNAPGGRITRARRKGHRLGSPESLEGDRTDETSVMEARRREPSPPNHAANTLRLSWSLAKFTSTNQRLGTESVKLFEVVKLRVCMLKLTGVALDGLTQKIVRVGLVTTLPKEKPP
jgi:hypothetical protein